MLRQLTTSTVLPITLAQVKAHLRLDHADEDDYLTFLIQSAVEAVQNYTGRSLMLQTWEKTYYQSQHYRSRISKQVDLPITVSLPHSPLLKINSVVGTHTRKIPQEITQYDLKFQGELAIIEIDQLFSKVKIVYEAGYGERPEAIPADIRQVILQLVALFYQKRQSFLLTEEPYLAALMQPYRIFRQV
ncbi:head-tail connector protein [Candidatus Paracaedibacter symbiosus]|uniref:head-tail connector protein n=1 Tax=Candidatus Paracaedibacter symbiosus TaxID=244582 RepID=UPI000509DFAA|nr:head-tail connector protein [Candidatus Paracaedibacter symbiosus]